jgi:hypothetical protein
VQELNVKKYYALFDKSNLQCIGVNYCEPHEETHLSDDIFDPILAIEVKDELIREDGTPVLSVYKFIYVDRLTVKAVLKRENLTTDDLERLQPDSPCTSFEDMQMAIISNIPDDYVLPANVKTLLCKALQNDRENFSRNFLYFEQLRFVAKLPNPPASIIPINQTLLNDDKCFFYWDHAEIDPDTKKQLRNEDKSLVVNRYYLQSTSDSSGSFVLAALFSTILSIYRKPRFVSAYRFTDDGKFIEGGFDALDKEYKGLTVQLGIFTAKAYTHYFRVRKQINFDVKTVADLKAIVAPDYSAIANKLPHTYTGVFSKIFGTALSWLSFGNKDVDTDPDTEIIMNNTSTNN